MRKLIVILGLLISTSAWAANTLTWVDNSPNEQKFNIERGVASSVANCATATFTQIASVPSNTTTFVDNAVTEGVTYCYRVNAENGAGVSAYSNIAGRLVPFTIPAAPSGLQVGP